MSSNHAVADNADTIPILLLKTKSVPNDGYEERFLERRNGDEEELKFQPIFVPVLEHRLLNDGMNFVREVLRKKKIGRDKRYGGLIFTSQRAVQAFAKLVDEGKGGDDDAWPHLQDVPIYTVGPATSRALRAIPQTPLLNVLGDETGNGEALAHFILDHYGERYKDAKIVSYLLFLVGEQRRDIIPKMLMDPRLSEERQMQVDEVVVYGTGVMESFEQDFMNLLQDTRDRRMRWVVVFSPTGCEAMLRALGLLDPETGKARMREEGENKTYIATIGPTTRDYLKEQFGFDPDICAVKPSPEGVKEGIRMFLKDKC